MERYNKNFGDFGENLAAEYLQKKGYTVSARNYRTKMGEIDIIAKKCNVVVFVEVKTRSSEKYGRPTDAVDLRKRKHMKEAAMWYYAENMLEDEARFDVIEIIARQLTDGEIVAERINHIEGIIIE